MTEALDTIRHALERGHILRLLAQGFGSSEMITVRTLQGALDALGYAVSAEGMGFHMVYLGAQGYVENQRRRDMAGWRSDRTQAGSPNEVMFAKLLPKGLQLLDGEIPVDPKVRF